MCSVSHPSCPSVWWSPNHTCSTVPFFTHVCRTVAQYPLFSTKTMSLFTCAFKTTTTLACSTAKRSVQLPLIGHSSSYLYKHTDHSTSLEELLDCRRESITGSSGRRHCWKFLVLMCVQHQALSQHAARGCRRREGVTAC